MIVEWKFQQQQHLDEAREFNVQFRRHGNDGTGWRFVLLIIRFSMEQWNENFLECLNFYRGKKKFKGDQTGKVPYDAYCLTQCSNGCSLGSFLSPRQTNHVQRCILTVRSAGRRTVPTLGFAQTRERSWQGLDWWFPSTSNLGKCSASIWEKFPTTS